MGWVIIRSTMFETLTQVCFFMAKQGAAHSRQQIKKGSSILKINNKTGVLFVCMGSKNYF